MTVYNATNLDAPHTQRELDQIPVSAPSAEKMAEAALARAGLVKRLRDPFPEYDYRSDAADRIEQLEAELERRKSLVFSQSMAHHAALMRAISNRQAERDQAHEDYMALMDELTAEKALADRLYGHWMSWFNGPDDMDHAEFAMYTAYRKARGL